MSAHQSAAKDFAFNPPKKINAVNIENEPKNKPSGVSSLADPSTSFAFTSFEDITSELYMSDLGPATEGPLTSSPKATTMQPPSTVSTAAQIEIPPLINASTQVQSFFESNSIVYCRRFCSKNNVIHNLTRQNQRQKSKMIFLQNRLRKHVCND